MQRFVTWCAAHGLSMPAMRGPHVAAYVEELGRELAPRSVKQPLAALRHWLDALVVGHVLEANPAHAVRGPRYAQSAGKTPVLEREEARALLDSIAGDDVIARRDKALSSVMLLSFARVGAVVGMKVRDYRAAGTARAAFHLHEKGGRFHAVPAHHRAAELVDAYVAAAGLSSAPDAPLWQGRRAGAESCRARR